MLNSPCSNSRRTSSLSASESEFCPICLDTTDLNDSIKTSCQHDFHAECLKGWLKSGQKNCPVCRQDPFAGYVTKIEALYEHIRNKDDLKLEESLKDAQVIYAINLVDIESESLLSQATKIAKLPLIQKLTQIGAIVTCETLINAAERGNVAIMQHLLSALSSLEPEEYQNLIDDLLHRALKAQRLAMSLYLIKSVGANFKNSILIVNDIDDFLTIERVLATKCIGCGIDDMDENGNTMLHLAAKKGRGDLLALWLSYGADIEARNKQGNTPLHEAAQHSAVAVKVLLRKGAQTQVKNKLDQTPVSLAFSVNNSNTIMAFRESCSASAN